MNVAAERITAVIPAYNCAAYVGQAVESVLCQTRPVDEIIVIDDGSTDNTASVLAPYSDRIRYVKQENRGASAARNRGVELAQGDWIALLDADDVWTPDKIQRQLQAAAQYPAAVLIYAQMANFVDEGHDQGVWPQRVCVSPDDRSLIRWWACLSDLPPTPTVLARTDVLRRCGGFDTTLSTAEDLDLWVRLLAIGPLVGVPAVLARRRLRSGSLTDVNHDVDQYVRYLAVLARRREEIRSWAGGAERGGRAAIHTMIANVHMREGRRMGQLKHAALGMLGDHPHRQQAVKLAAEAIFGRWLYGAMSGIFKSLVLPQTP
jgi:glycosyltransferase involved in cell wall biosynthesis